MGGMIDNELSSTMEGVNLQDDDDEIIEPISLLPNLAEQATRPLDFLGAVPSDPIPFPQARYDFGKRADVLCYNADTDSHEVVKNVLFRDYSRSSLSADDDAADCRVKEAYYRVPFKAPIKTIMGHVEICIVLERCLRNPNSTDNDSYEDDEESCGDDDDIVFQWTQRRVAVKVNYCDRMERLKNRHAEDPLKEIAAMQLIGDKHPNVLGCQQVLFDGKNLNIVMRYCEGGDLFQLLQESQASPAQAQQVGLSEGEARYWFRQIIAGLNHIHSVGICHRDLSPENVMIDDESSLIIDMGMCLRIPYCAKADPNRVMDINQAHDLATRFSTPVQRCFFKPQGACGKLPYMCPEIYKNRTAFDGAAADVWTAGTILFCMVTGNRSYQRPHSSDPQFYWMSRGLPQLISDWGVVLSPEGMHLLQNMLQVDPRLRLSLEEVVHHPWFALPDGPRPAAIRAPSWMSDSIITI
jgi:serine/threonine protein kinase